MKTAGFWISRHLYADKVVLERSKVEAFNKHIQEDLKLTRDMAQFPDVFSAEELRSSFKKELLRAEFLMFGLGKGIGPLWQQHTGMLIVLPTRVQDRT